MAYAHSGGKVAAAGQAVRQRSRGICCRQVGSVRRSGIVHARYEGVMRSASVMRYGSLLRVAGRKVLQVHAL